MNCCGACGYSVAGASTFICTECGNDLRAVGIHRGKDRSIRLLIGRCFALAILIGVTVALLALMLSRVGYFHVNRQVEFEQPESLNHFSPTLKPIRVTIAGNGIRWPDGPIRQADPWNSVTFEVDPPAGTRGALIASLSGSCTVAGGSQRPIDRKAIEDWLTRTGLDPSSPEWQSVPDDVLQSIAVLCAGRPQDVGFSRLEARSFADTSSGHGNRLLTPLLVTSGSCGSSAVFSSGTIAITPCALSAAAASVMFRSRMHPLSSAHFAQAMSVSWELMSRNITPSAALQAVCCLWHSDP